MSLLTVNVTIITSLLTGQPNALGRVYFELSSTDLVPGPQGGIVVPAQVEVILDALGQAVVPLYVNNQGQIGTDYIVEIFDEDGNKAGTYRATVPPNDCFLHQILDLAPIPALDAALSAVLAAQAAAAAAQTSAANAQASFLATEAVVFTDNYVHTQGVPSSEWIITHNLNKYPSVVVEDSTGDEAEGSLFYDSLNVLRIVFSAAFSGRALLN